MSENVIKGSSYISDFQGSGDKKMSGLESLGYIPENSYFEPPKISELDPMFLFFQGHIFRFQPFVFGGGFFFAISLDLEIFQRAVISLPWLFKLNIVDYKITLRWILNGDFVSPLYNGMSKILLPLLK